MNSSLQAHVDPTRGIILKWTDCIRGGRGCSFAVTAATESSSLLLRAAPLAVVSLALSDDDDIIIMHVKYNLLIVLIYCISKIS